MRYVSPPAEYHVTGPYVPFSAWAEKVGKWMYRQDHCIGACVHDYHLYRRSPDGWLWDAGGTPVGRLQDPDFRRRNV